MTKNKSHLKKNAFKFTCMVIFLTLAGCKEDSPPTRQNMGGISSGGIFAVTLPPETKLFIQEYWHNGTPKYLVYNQNTVSSELNIHQLFIVETDPNLSGFEKIKGDHLAGSWLVNANSFAHFDIQRCLVQSWKFGDALLGVFLQPEKSAGSLFPPVSNEATLFQPNLYTSIYGMNGLDYMRRATSWFEFDSMQVSSQENFNITLKLTGDFVSVQFQKITSPNDLSIPSIEVVSASSSDLRIVDIGGQIIIYKDNASTSDTHLVSVQVRAPSITSSTMAYLDGFRCEQKNGSECLVGYSLPRGILVTP